MHPDPYCYSFMDLRLGPALPRGVGPGIGTGCTALCLNSTATCLFISDIGSPYSIIERRVPELIPVLGSRPAGDVSHRPGGRLPLLSARPAVTPATLKSAATNFAAC